eukprot:scaffold3415_cov368-Prasinococcus_capsulatus_cf.AAC.11
MERANSTLTCISESGYARPFVGHEACASLFLLSNGGRRFRGRARTAGALGTDRQQVRSRTAACRRAAQTLAGAVLAHR